ncbi:hypothetical protein LSH36_1134g02068 [Paralvinella palmiformis]|uniref:Uncharacterized protein n=1 Tax=Paralvinella palmiformis TaxID=53620 RepID=A0AAD9IUJ7_9ANNE|nr:hypothetical protein LSH36_1134g02068 [Paralvinella palmiformis]
MSIILKGACMLTKVNVHIQSHNDGCLEHASQGGTTVWRQTWDEDDENNDEHVSDEMAGVGDGLVLGMNERST